MDPLITILVVAYKRYHHLPIMIHSFLTQTDQSWKMVILHDGPDSEHEKLVRPYVNDYPNISYYQSEQRFNDWGHSLREWGIREHLDTPWALITNDDNYYVPTFVDNCHQIIKREPSVDFIMFDALMNTPITNSLNPNHGYQTQFSFPETSLIDMGSFIVKSNLLKKIGFQSKVMAADGILVETILKSYPDMKLFKINQTLFVHN